MWEAAQTMDAQRAMGVARLHAAAWGLNASRLGFTGFSAGGHLTARISTNWAARLYARVDAADDLPCRPDFSLLIYPWALLANNFINSTELSPELAVSASHPPACFAVRTPFCPHEALRPAASARSRRPQPHPPLPLKHAMAADQLG